MLWPFHRNTKWHSNRLSCSGFLHRRSFYSNHCQGGVLVRPSLSSVSLSQVTNISFLPHSRKLMLGICKIHQAGIVHNALESRFHLMRHGKEPRIIDFSQAKRHHCRGAYPADRYGDLQGSPDIPWCMELAKLEGFYGMKSGDPPDQHEWPALVPSLSSVTQLLSNFAFSG